MIRFKTVVRHNGRKVGVWNRRAKRRRPRDRDKLLVRSADGMVDVAGSVCRPEEGEDPEAWARRAVFNEHAFPRLAGLSLGTPWPDGRVVSYMSNRMRNAWHPDARAYVYAFSLRYEVDEEQLEEFCDDHPGCLVDVCDRMVKVGTCVNLERRLPGLQTDPTPIGVPKERYLASHLLCLPCARVGTASALEEFVLSSLPSDDHLGGEWWLDTFGVWKILRAWFVAAHICQAEQPR